MPKSQFERYLVRRPCVAYLREMIVLKQLTKYPFLYWQCSPDHARVTAIQAGNLKLDGYEKGCFDMVIVGADKESSRTWLIEFKHGKNDYTNEQRYVANRAAETPVQCLKIHSRDEFAEFIESELK